MLLPLWSRALKELKVETEYIWVFRNPLEVAESLRKRDGYNRRYSLLLWSHYNLSILKSLQDKEYKLINYRDVLRGTGVLGELGRLFNCKLNDSLITELNCMIKSGFCHSTYSYQDVLDVDQGLAANLYSALLKRQETIADMSELEKYYEKAISKVENRYIDYQALENIKCLEGREIIIYGAGKCGMQAAEMLEQLGFLKYSFCDKDIDKQGMSLRRGKIFSIDEIEGREHLLFIIAIENKKVRREIEQTLSYLRRIAFLSFFALKEIYMYSARNLDSSLFNAQGLLAWYKELEYRANTINSAYRAPILIYQNGKVGSTTVSKSLWNVGVENAHVHRLFFKNDIVGELILGEKQAEFIKASNFFSCQFPEYTKAIKSKIKGKKIITMVREPIAVDLSTIFEWVGSGITTRFCTTNTAREYFFAGYF